MTPFTIIQAVHLSCMWESLCWWCRTTPTVITNGAILQLIMTVICRKETLLCFFDSSMCRAGCSFGQHLLLKSPVSLQHMVPSTAGSSQLERLALDVVIVFSYLLVLLSTDPAETAWFLYCVVLCEQCWVDYLRIVDRYWFFLNVIHYITHFR